MTVRAVYKTALELSGDYQGRTEFPYPGNDVVAWIDNARKIQKNRPIEWNKFRITGRVTKLEYELARFTRKANGAAGYDMEMYDTEPINLKTDLTLDSSPAGLAWTDFKNNGHYSFDSEYKSIKTDPTNPFPMAREILSSIRVKGKQISVTDYIERSKKNKKLIKKRIFQDPTFKARCPKGYLFDWTISLEAE